MRIAVFGYGSIGQRHVKNLIDAGQKDLIIYDPAMIERDQDKIPGPNLLYTNVLEYVWRENPDAVLICSPPYTHYDLLSRCARYKTGLPVFVEKPVVHAATYAKMLLAANEDWKLKIAVGYQLRWQLDGIVSSDLEIVSRQDMIQWPSQYQKDVLLEFSHEIDAACYINGPVKDVSACENSKGWLIDLQHLRYRTAIHIDAHSKTYDRNIFYGINGPLAWSFSRQDNDLCYKDELKAFLTACNHPNIWPDKLCTLAQAAHVVKVIDACKQSAKHFEVVSL